MLRGAFLLPVILAWAALTAGQAFAEGDAAAGKKVFKRCLVCHTDVEGKHKQGPTLHKVLGRAAGTAKGFRYSPAYVRAGKQGLVWSDETLFRIPQASQEIPPQVPQGPQGQVAHDHEVLQEKGPA